MAIASPILVLRAIRLLDEIENACDTTSPASIVVEVIGRGSMSPFLVLRYFLGCWPVTLSSVTILSPFV